VGENVNMVFILPVISFHVLVPVWVFSVIISEVVKVAGSAIVSVDFFTLAVM